MTRTAAARPVGSRGRGAVRAALAAVVIGHVAAALYPFDWDPPRDIPNEVVRLADGSLRFTGPSSARTAGPVPWLPDAVAAGEFGIHLEVVPARSHQAGPARLLAVSLSVLAANVMVGQEGDDLVVRLRQPGRDGSGNPARVVPDVFAAGEPTAVDVTVEPGALAVAVDGREEVREPLPAGALDGWDLGYPLALGNEPRGARPWLGTVRAARVTWPGGSADYLREGALELPPTFRYITHRPWQNELPGSPRELAGQILRLAVAVPLGALAVPALSRRWHAASLAAGAGAFFVALQVVKIGFAGRHPSLVDAAVETAGAAAGVALAAGLLRTRTRRAGRLPGRVPGSR